MMSKHYQNYEYHLRQGRHDVAGFTKSSDPAQSSGLPAYKSITLERGVTADPDFHAWATDPKSVRKTFKLDRLDLLGKICQTYVVRDCIAAHFLALPDIDAGSSVVSVASLRLTCVAVEPERPRVRRTKSGR